MTDKTANRMWGGRFAMSPAEIMEEINASIGFDKALAPQDIRASKAHAAMHGRDFVLPDDVDALAVPVIAHRLVPTSRAIGAHDRDSGPLIDAIVRRIVGETPVPVGSARRS